MHLSIANAIQRRIFTAFSVLHPFQEEQNLATPASEWTPNFESKAGHNSRQQRALDILKPLETHVR